MINRAQEIRMKIVHKANEDGYYLSLQEIYGATVLETKEGNQLAICMRDDTIEMRTISADGKICGEWFRADMQNGTIGTERYIAAMQKIGMRGLLITKLLELPNVPDELVDEARRLGVKTLPQDKKGCGNCQYSQNGTVSCFRGMDYAEPKIDITKGIECAGNNNQHWLLYKGVDNDRVKT